MAKNLNDALARFYIGRMGGWFKFAPVVAGQILLQTFEVTGCYDHSIQVTALNGSDVLQVRASLDGTNFEKINNTLDALNANGLYLFQGVFNYLSVARTSGTGSTTGMLYQGRP